MGTLTLSDMVLRVGVAFLAGAAVGWERESHGRAAGFRTTILACVAAAVAMVLSEVLFAQSALSASASWRPDPARLGAGILTGIGFLGAGTILRHADTIRGVTTAASLWIVTVLGLTFGSGEFALGLIGVTFALLTLLVLPRFERHIVVHSYATLTVSAEFTFMNECDFRRHIETLGPAVKSMRLHYDVETRKKTFVCDVKLTKSERFSMSSKVVNDLSKLPGVLSVGWT
jgi:putative Mg2+ transporter-C (MgtC) family protein